MCNRTLDLTHPQGFNTIAIEYLCGHRESHIMPLNATPAMIEPLRTIAAINMCFTCNYFTRTEVIRTRLASFGMALNALYGSRQQVLLAESIRLEVLTDVLRQLGDNDKDIATYLANDVKKRDHLHDLLGMSAHEWIESSRMDRVIGVFMDEAEPEPAFQSMVRNTTKFVTTNNSQ